MVARDGVEPFWGVCYQSNPLESRTALPFRDSRDRLTVQIQYTANVGSASSATRQVTCTARRSMAAFPAMERSSRWIRAATRPFYTASKEGRGTGAILTEAWFGTQRVICTALP